MDLTRSFPRSPKETMAGVAMLPRTADKARAFDAGTLGAYKYDCPLDREVFGFLGIDQGEFARQAVALDDRTLEEWVRSTFVAKKTSAEIEAFNLEFLADAPTPGSESEQRFLKLRESIQPGRTDVTTWPALLDLEEGRSPRPAAART